MSRKIHLESIELAQAYAAEHPEMENLINTFVRMSGHPKAMCKIQIGNFGAEDETFTCKLTSNVRFARTLFGSIEGEPAIYIRNNSFENVCFFNMSYIEKILKQEKHSYPRPLNYEKETFVFAYCGDDYKLTATFE